MLLHRNRRTKAHSCGEFAVAGAKGGGEEVGFVLAGEGVIHVAVHPMVSLPAVLQRRRLGLNSGWSVRYIDKPQSLLFFLRPRTLLLWVLLLR